MQSYGGAETYNKPPSVIKFVFHLFEGRIF